MVDFVGSIQGLDKCPRCKDEVSRIRTALRNAPELTSIFAGLNYVEKRMQMPFDKNWWTFELLCKGTFSYRQKDGVITSILVKCNG